MWNDWILWLSSKSTAELVAVLAPLVCFDGCRYCLANVAMCLWDAVRDARCTLGQFAADDVDPYTPDVCVILAGLNEADTIGSTLHSVWGSYPRLEIIVVDDGSSDGMADVAHEFALTHDRVTVLRKPQRGGKSSALNFAIPYASAEVVVCVDTDSHLEPGAIATIVQPFRDPTVGAVAGTVVARNAHVNLASRLQAAEYLRSIFLGRMLSSRLGVLGIVSGAFGAFRRSALTRTGGWDVGPGEDGDLVLRLRKAGWRIVHAPYAQCLTNVPLSWSRLFKQRRRWEWAVVTFECRKHIDMANVRSPNFRWSNLALLAESWVFRVGLSFAMVAGLAWLATYGWQTACYVLLLNYLAYAALEAVQWCVLMYYTPDPRRDAWTLAMTPIAPLYYMFLKCASLVAFVEEFLWRRSYDDNFVPLHVRSATWHW